MAKSVRAQSKKRSRAIKRKEIFQPVVDARIERLAKKQAEAADGPKLLESEGGMAVEDVPISDDNAQTAMSIDKPKISTSGPRTSRNQIRKQKKIAASKKKTKNGNKVFKFH
ncbi:uncharacterized protein VTP21DRAFT_8254 [Calcarisporiella thermophila]|uniref:uncharacterized protein n=1 Tax=Calcarisporiella thermophila TaxID=911321 RepID=UPI0037449428